MTYYDTTENIDRQRLIETTAELEEAILGGILLDPSAIARIADWLPPEAFWIERHRKIYRVCLTLYRNNDLVDLMTVTMRLSSLGQLQDIGGTGKLAQLLDRTISAVNIDRYSQALINKYTQRKIFELSQEIASDAVNSSNWMTTKELLSSIEAKVLEFTRSYCDEPANNEQQKYERLITQIKDIEQKTLDPGFKYYRLMELADQRKMSIKSLQNLYLKHLASQENEPMMNLGDLKATYGSNVQEWFLHGFAPKGSVVLLHALGGTGKTRLIYDWIYHMVTGSPWGQGKDGTGQKFRVTSSSRKVLILQTDESQGDLLNALDLRGFTEDMPIKIKTRWTTEHMAALRQDIETWRPDVILIDSLTSINRHSLFSENDTEYARPVLELRDLAQEFGCLIYLIHHSNSEGGSRGTKAIANSVSHVFSLSRPSQGSDPRTLDRILCIEKSRARTPAKYKLKFEPEDSSWVCEGIEGLDSERDIKDKIIDFLWANQGDRFEPIEIVNEIGGSISRVRLICFQLAADGEISRIRRYKKGSGYLYFVGEKVIAEDFWQSSPITFENQVPASNSGEVDRGQKSRSTTRSPSEAHSQQGIQAKLIAGSENFSDLDSEKMKFHEGGDQLRPEPNHSKKVEVDRLIDRGIGEGDRDQLPEVGDQLLDQLAKIIKAQLGDYIDQATIKVLDRDLLDSAIISVCGEECDTNEIFDQLLLKFPAVAPLAQVMETITLEAHEICLDDPEETSDQLPPARPLPELGDQVLYIGQANNHIKACGMKKLIVLSVEGEKAKVGYKEWKVNREIPIKDLEVKDRGRYSFCLCEIEDGKISRFWNGQKWDIEYTHAFRYVTEAKAREALKKRKQELPQADLRINNLTTIREILNRES